MLNISLLVFRNLEFRCYSKVGGFIINRWGLGALHDPEDVGLEALDVRGQDAERLGGALLPEVAEPLAVVHPRL